MSYYALSGPTGEGEAECEDHPSGVRDYCIGYEKSCPHYADVDCCPASGWYNWVYEDIKGHQSMRANHEKKVRSIGNMLVVPDQYGETGIQRFAYDHGSCPVDTCAPELFQEAARLAFASFDAAFPEQRFIWDPNDRESDDCGEYGGFDEDSRHWYKKRFDAVARAADVELSDTFKGLVLERGLADYTTRDAWRYGTGETRVVTSGGVGIGAWLDTVRDIVHDVPGGQQGQYIDSMPRMQDLLVVGSSGYVGPTPWLGHFIAALIPKRASTGRVTAGPVSPGQVTAGPVTTNPWATPPKGVWARIAPERGRPAPKLAMSGAAAAGASVVAFGIGYLLARRLA